MKLNILKRYPSYDVLLMPSYIDSHEIFFPENLVDDFISTTTRSVCSSSERN
jgi:hypothetical protein